MRRLLTILLLLAPAACGGDPWIGVATEGSSLDLQILGKFPTENACRAKMKVVGRPDVSTFKQCALGCDTVGDKVVAGCKRIITVD